MDVLVSALTAAALIIAAPLAGIGIARASAATVGTVAPSVPESGSAGLSRPIDVHLPAARPLVPVASLVTTVPAVVKAPRASAIRALRRAGYRVYVGKPRFNAKVGKGRVCVQVLKAGARLRRGRTVTIYVSKGAKPRIHWKTARVSVYGGASEAQTVAGPYGSTRSLERRHVLYFAHKSMRFGTKVRFNYRGHLTTAICVDRGPYVSGRMFDLGVNTARALHFDGVGRLSWVIVK